MKTRRDRPFRSRSLLYTGNIGQQKSASAIEDLMEARKDKRVIFERGYTANMMAIDGTWRRSCIMEDVSDTGAKLTIDGSIEGLNLKEFFLLLSTMGKAYRRCQLAWVNGDQVGVFFLKPGNKKKS